MSRLYALLLVTGFLITASASAQEPPQVGLTEVRSGQFVRIRTSQGQLLEGRFSTSPARDAKLQLTNRDLALTDTAIDSLWVRGNRAKTGALIGGLVLGAGSAVGWNELCEIYNEGRGCDETGRVVALTVAGAAIGVALGALIGSRIPTWRLQYARPTVRLTALSLDRVALVVRVPL